MQRKKKTLRAIYLIVLIIQNDSFLQFILPELCEGVGAASCLLTVQFSVFLLHFRHYCVAVAAGFQNSDKNSVDAAGK